MLKIKDKQFNNRLIIGTGKFSSNLLMQETIIASETEMVTVALRRVDLNAKSEDIMDFIPKNIQLLPNTSGAKNADEAIRIARICRAALGTEWIKLEVIPDPVYLLPDPIEVLKASEVLVKEGFVVFPYINADPVLAKRLENIGCATVMPLGSPIGTNKGLKTIEMIKIIIDTINIPVIVDAGIGKPSDAAIAMEIGADAVLVNTALAVSNNPVEIARAFNLAVKAGRAGYEFGLPNTIDKAQASSPLTNFLGE